MCCLFKKKTVLNLRISHAKKLLFSGSKVPEFMISCEYIRILKYCMYISTTERRLPFINYSEWRKNEGYRRWKERKICVSKSVSSAKPVTAVTLSSCSSFIPKTPPLEKIVDLLKIGMHCYFCKHFWKVVSHFNYDKPTNRKFSFCNSNLKCLWSKMFIGSFKDGLAFGMRPLICYFVVYCLSPYHYPPSQKQKKVVKYHREPVIVAVVGWVTWICKKF